MVLDSTPFYAESGGQIGDHGTLTVADGSDSQGHCLIRVSDVQKAAGGSLFVHTARVESGTLQVGAQVCPTLRTEFIGCVCRHALGRCRRAM